MINYGLRETQYWVHTYIPTYIVMHLLHIDDKPLELIIRTKEFREKRIGPRAEL